MTTKTAQLKAINGNGNGEAPFTPPVRKLEGFQAKYLRRLIESFEKAKEQVTMIQASASDFIAACAEEEGIVIGQDGWQFDSEKMEFFQIRTEGSAGGNDS